MRWTVGSWSQAGSVPRLKEWRTGCGSGGNGARWHPVCCARRGWCTAWTSMRAPAVPGCPTTCGHGWTRWRRQGAEALTSGLWRPFPRGRIRRQSRRRGGGRARGGEQGGRRGVRARRVSAGSHVRGRRRVPRLRQHGRGPGERAAAAHAHRGAAPSPGEL